MAIGPCLAQGSCKNDFGFSNKTVAVLRQRNTYDEASSDVHTRMVKSAPPQAQTSC
jgi:hypothetical protein